MQLEHILYSFSLAILVGLYYDKTINKSYTSKSFLYYALSTPAMLIVFTAYILDTDYIAQYTEYILIKLFHTHSKTLYVIHHGDFHNIFMICVFTIILGYVYKVYYGDFTWGLICAGIGSSFHLICDFVVYNRDYYIYMPFNHIPTHAWNIIPETYNLGMFGDTKIIMIGILFILLAIIIVHSNSYITTNKTDIYQL